MMAVSLITAVSLLYVHVYAYKEAYDASLEPVAADLENSISGEYAAFTENTQTNKNSIAKVRRMDFVNGDVFEVRKLTPTQDFTWLSQTIFLPGENMKIRFFDSNKNFVSQTAAQPLPRATMFIETTECEAVVALCSCYAMNEGNHTIVPQQSRERPFVLRAVEQPEKGYQLLGGCSAYPGESMQFWYLISEEKNNTFFKWTKHIENQMRLDNLGDTHSRLCYDGYYFPASESYLPYHKGMMFRHPSCYAGVSFARYGGCRMIDELGYALVRIAAEEQNVQGYWETGATSSWLSTDFNINGAFYDTRFNTDLANGLVDIYYRYHDPVLMNALLRYAEFYMKHAERNNLIINDGILVRDYAASSGSFVPTHSSLNHHASELYFVNKLTRLLNSLTPEEKEQYEDFEFVKEPQIMETLAERMLKGIENTVDYWIMPDNNLRYAYGYNGTANSMLDYPYLTYNDLFVLNRQITETTGAPNTALQRLMSAKKNWMDSNGVTGYYQ